MGKKPVKGKRSNVEFESPTFCEFSNTFLQQSKMLTFYRYNIGNVQVLFSSLFYIKNPVME